MPFRRTLLLRNKVILVCCNVTAANGSQIFVPGGVLVIARSRHSASSLAVERQVILSLHPWASCPTHEPLVPSSGIVREHLLGFVVGI